MAARTRWSKAEWIHELGKAPEEGGLGAREISHEDFEQEQIYRIGEQLPLPVDHDTLGQVELDKNGCSNI
eukprot:9255541-Pyramimonas_sp.AAC.1